MKKIGIFMIAVIMGVTLLTGCGVNSTAGAQNDISEQSVTEVPDTADNQETSEVNQRDVQDLETYVRKVKNNEIPLGTPVDKDYGQMIKEDMGKLMRD